MKKYRVRKFHRPKKRIIVLILKSRAFWLFVLFLLFLGTASYFLFFTDYLKIKNIDISGNSRISSNEIAGIANQELSSNFLGVIPKNILLADLKKIDDEIIRKFPLVSKADVKRKLFNSLSVNIEERTAVALWCKDQDCFSIDKEGVVFEKGGESSFIIRENNDINIGENVISEDSLKNILEIYNKVREVSIKEISISDAGKITAKTSYGWNIYFSEGDIASQIVNLNLVLENKIPPESRGNLEYIDLRFGNKVFYKSIGAENKD